MADSDSLKFLTEQVVKFRDRRDWKQFHSLRSLAISLNLEAAEVLDHFQWSDELRWPEKFPGELADVLYHLLLLSHEAGIDLGQAFMDKLKESDKKYPVDKSKGNAKKYTDYEKD